MKLNRLNKRLFVCVVAFFTIVLCGFIYCAKRPYSVNQIMADRTALAESPSQLETESDLIVLVSPQTSENVLIKDPDDQNIILGYTKTIATILDVVKGDIEQGQKISITEECYTTDFNSVLWTQEGYLPMKQGNQYLLFLKAYEETSDYSGMYFPIDLEYGKYLIPQAALASEVEPSYTAEQLQVGDETDLDNYVEWYQTIVGFYLK